MKKKTVAHWRKTNGSQDKHKERPWASLVILQEEMIVTASVALCEHKSILLHFKPLEIAL